MFHASVLLRGEDGKVINHEINDEKAPVKDENIEINSISVFEHWEHKFMTNLMCDYFCSKLLQRNVTNEEPKIHRCQVNFS